MYEARTPGVFANVFPIGQPGDRRSESANDAYVDRGVGPSLNVLFALGGLNQIANERHGPRSHWYVSQDGMQRMSQPYAMERVFDRFAICRVRFERGVERAL